MTSFWLPDETGFSYRNGALFCEDVPVAELADKYGTPSFIYSRKAIETAFRDYDGAFGSHPHHILYSVKACSNIRSEERRVGKECRSRWSPYH